MGATERPYYAASAVFIVDNTENDRARPEKSPQSSSIAAQEGSFFSARHAMQVQIGTKLLQMIFYIVDKMNPEQHPHASTSSITSRHHLRLAALCNNPDTWHSKCFSRHSIFDILGYRLTRTCQDCRHVPEQLPAAGAPGA